MDRPEDLPEAEEHIVNLIKEIDKLKIALKQSRDALLSCQTHIDMRSPAGREWQHAMDLIKEILGD